MITGKFVTDEERLALAGKLRMEIFQDRPMTEIFPHPKARYALLWVDGNPAGMGGVLVEDDRFMVIELGILEEYQMQGYGDFLLRVMATPAFDDRMKKIYADVSEDGEAFFLATHFVPDGEAYAYLGRKRIPMALDLDDLRCACSKGKFNPYRP